MTQDEASDFKGTSRHQPGSDEYGGSTPRVKSIAEAERYLRLSDSVVMTELNGEAILLDLRSEAYFGLDELGTRIWTLLAAGLTHEQIMAQLLDEYDVTPTELYEDLCAFLQALLEKQLIVVESV